MPQPPNGFFQVCNTVAKSLGEYGPIGSLTFVAIFCTAATACITSNPKTTAIVGIFSLLLATAAMIYYLLDARTQLSHARLKVDRTEALGKARKERARLKVATETQVSIQTAPRDVGPQLTVIPQPALRIGDQGDI